MQREKLARESRQLPELDVAPTAEAEALAPEPVPAVEPSHEPVPDDDLTDEDFGDVTALAAALGVDVADVRKALRRIGGPVAMRLFVFADDVFEKMRREVEAMEAELEEKAKDPTNTAFVSATQSAAPCAGLSSVTCLR